MRTRRLVLSALLCLLITGCGSEPDPPGQDGAAGSAPRPTPTLTPGTPMSRKVPAAPGPVTLPDGALVTENEDGTSTLCIGGQDLLPNAPCRGVELVGFTWPAGATADAPARRSGFFRVVGTFDGTRLTVTKAIPDRPGGDAEPNHPRGTPCAAPSGGWRVVDPALVSGTAAGRLARAARKVRGYAGLWLDHETEVADENVTVIMNVAVSRDPEDAERALRKVWGGALCVSSTRHSVHELIKIVDRVMRLPGAENASAGYDEVPVDVLYDDGSLQAWADREYGPGLVKARSALVPAGGAPVAPSS